MRSFTVHRLPSIFYCDMIMKISWTRQITRVVETTLKPVNTTLADLKD